MKRNSFFFTFETLNYFLRHIEVWFIGSQLVSWGLHVSRSIFINNWTKKMDRMDKEPSTRFFFLSTKCWTWMEKTGDCLSLVVLNLLNDKDWMKNLRGNRTRKLSKLIYPQTNIKIQYQISSKVCFKFRILSKTL